MVIPIEEAMVNRENFTPILSVVMVIYTTLCVLSGGLGYLAFGDATEVSIGVCSRWRAAGVRVTEVVWLICDARGGRAVLPAGRLQARPPKRSGQPRLPRPLLYLREVVCVCVYGVR